MSVMEPSCPVTYEEAAQALHEAASTGNAAILGGGSRETWFPPAREARTAISSSALTGIVRYTPADLTVCVRAGTPLEEVQRALGEHGQWLPLDPHPAGSVGGVIAANDNGPVRARYGGVRDALIGVRVALPNGSVARFGGDVVKNVAGYDLTKAYVGSAGAFGMLVEATFKVQPLPPVVRAWRIEGPTAALREAATSLRSRELPFAALDLAGTTGGQAWHLGALAHGEIEVVDRLGRELASAASSAGLHADETDAGAIEAQAARPSRAGAWMRAGVPRAASLALLDALPAGVEVIARPSIGIVEVYGPEADSEALGGFAAVVAERGGHVHLRLGGAHLRAGFGWWRARDEGGSRIFGMLKRALDPDLRCNAGRTVYDQHTEEG
ncbi:MAG TPA: FAD-binding protein [Candidatus Dormibacteraeota bacterium]|nr:FAD-binding protein [Candidatus Dormibacteraeota bacterium]